MFLSTIPCVTLTTTSITICKFKIKHFWRIELQSAMNYLYIFILDWLSDTTSHHIAQAVMCSTQSYIDSSGIWQECCTLLFCYVLTFDAVILANHACFANRRSIDFQRQWWSETGRPTLLAIDLGTRQRSMSQQNCWTKTDIIQERLLNYSLMNKDKIYQIQTRVAG